MKNLQSQDIIELKKVLTRFFEKSSFLINNSYFTDKILLNNEMGHQTFVCCRNLIADSLYSTELDSILKNNEGSFFYEKMSTVNVILKSISKLYDLFLIDAEMPINKEILCFKLPDSLSGLIKNDRQFFELLLNCFILNPTNIIIEKNGLIQQYSTTQRSTSTDKIKIVSNNSPDYIIFNFSSSEINAFLKKLIYCLVPVNDAIEKKIEDSINSLAQKEITISGDYFDKIETLKKESDIRMELFDNEISSIEEFIDFGFASSEFSSDILDELLLKIRGELQDSGNMMYQKLLNKDELITKIRQDIKEIQMRLIDSFLDENKKQDARKILL